MPDIELGRAGSLKCWALAAVCVCVLIHAGVAAAQAPENAGVPIFHVYTNLVQVPTLVLGQDRKPIPAIDERRFFVSLDSGPRFRVTHARLEGDDALSVAILLDKSQADTKTLSLADEAIASLVPLSLHAKDSVSIYAMDCRVVHVTGDGAADAATLKRDVDLVLEGSRARNERGAGGKCHDPANLLDSLTELVHTLSTQPGRRVILALTDGVDRGSHHSWNELRQFAQSSSVTIFGFMAPVDLLFRAQARAEPKFEPLCQSSGGLVLETTDKDFGKQLAWAVKLLRARYIVEFPRPMSTEGGMHNLEVTILKSEALILPSGASFPMVDPTVLSDPTTIQSDPSHAPQLGNRKILSPK